MAMLQPHTPSRPFEVAHQLRIEALKSLCNPRRAGLISTLEYISNNITSRHHDELPYWLQDNLFPRLLAILRALPTLTYSPAHTASICSGTAAVLCNIIHVARTHGTSMPPWFKVDSMLAQASAPDILAVVVKYGMLSPSALDPAARFEHDLHLEPVAGYIPYAVAAAAAHAPGPGHEFWTHLRISGHLLATVALGDSAEIDCSSQYLHQVQAVLSQLADERVFLHLLESAVEYTGEMPWVVMAAAAHSNISAARSCLWKLMPLLRLVLEGMKGGLQCLAFPDKARLVRMWTPCLMTLSAAVVLGGGPHEGYSAADRDLNLELMVVVLDFALSLQHEVQQEVLSEASEPALATVEPGLGAGQPGLGAVEPGLGAAEPVLGSVEPVPAAADIVPSGVIAAGCVQLKCAAQEWAGAKEALLEPLLQQGVLLRWLVGMHVLGPAAAQCLVQLASLMLEAGGTGAAGDSPAAWHIPWEELAAQFLQGLLTEGLPALKWAVEQVHCPELGASALHLVHQLMVAHYSSLLESYQTEVLDGILGLMDGVQWGRICTPSATRLLELCKEGASEEHLSKSCFTARDIFKNIALPVLEACACGEALAAVAPHVAWLAELEAELGAQLLEVGAAGSSGQQQQQAEACLVAIGRHIEGAKWPSWLDGLVTPVHLWGFVAASTRLSGDQLSRWHAGIKEPEASGNHPLPSHLASQPSNHQSKANADAAAAAAFQLLCHLDPAYWWNLATLQTLPGFLMCPTDAVRCPAEEATLAAIASMLAKHPAMGSWTFAGYSQAAAPLLTSNRATLRRPWRFSEEALGDGAAALPADMWLAAAAMCVGIASHFGSPVSMLQLLSSSQGWGGMKAWSLGYAKGTLASSTDARQAGRRALRFACAVELAKFMAEGASCQPELQVLGEQWLRELEEAGRDVGWGGSQRAAEARAKAQAATAAAAAAEAAVAPLAVAASGSSDSDDTTNVSDLASSPSATATAAAAVAPAASAEGRRAVRRQCARCGDKQKHLQWCKGCKEVKYCNAECQKVHWNLHKADCRRLRLQQQLMAAPAPTVTAACADEV